jgi:hypothetical protein
MQLPVFVELAPFFWAHSVVVSLLKYRRRLSGPLEFRGAERELHPR